MNRACIYKMKRNKWESSLAACLKKGNGESGFVVAFVGFHCDRSWWSCKTEKIWAERYFIFQKQKFIRPKQINIVSDEVMHKVHLPIIGSRVNIDEQEKTADYWINAAQAALQSKLSNRLNTSKFIIMFLSSVDKLQLLKKIQNNYPYTQKSLKNQIKF